MTFAAILWISNFIGSARILAKNHDDLQKLAIVFVPLPPTKKQQHMARETKGVSIR